MEISNPAQLITSKSPYYVVHRVPVDDDDGIARALKTYVLDSLPQPLTKDIVCYIKNGNGLVGFNKTWANGLVRRVYSKSQKKYIPYWKHNHSSFCSKMAVGDEYETPSRDIAHVL